MSAPRRDNSQSPDPATGHGMGRLAKNGGDAVSNGPMIQPNEYDQWRSRSIYPHNGSLGPLTPTQPAPGDYMTTSFFAASPYAMNDHLGGWTPAPPASFYHPPGFSPPVNNQYLDHMTLFGGGPAPAGNSFFYNYFPTNGSDYNTWGGPSIIAAPRNGTSAGGSAPKHSEFYYNPMADGGYTHYIGTDIVGNCGGTNGVGHVNVGQQLHPANFQLGHLEHGVSRMNVYDEIGVPARTSLSSNGQYGDNGTTAVVGHHTVGSTTSNQHSSVGADSKKKSWATIASQPAKPNSGGSGGGFLGTGKGKGRVPIGGVPGSTSSDCTSASQNAGDTGNGFWAPSPVVSSNSNSTQAVNSKVEQDGKTELAGTGCQISQKSHGALTTNVSSSGGFWSSTNSASGKATKTISGGTSNNDIVQPPRQQNLTNGSGKGSENGDCYENDVVSPTDAASVKAGSLDKLDPQKQQPNPVVGKLIMENGYNPKELILPTKGARYFVIKSYSEDDVHRSIKYRIWCSTDHGNKRLDGAYREREAKGPIYLLFSVNGSGHFCGVAQMTSPLDYNKSSGVWAQDKWKGQFSVKWIYVKDVPNAQLRHIRLENNENKPVTNSRDTQEVPPEKGRQVLKIIHQYRHTTSLFDDFGHYEKRQEEEDQRKGRRANVDE